MGSGGAPALTKADPVALAVALGGILDRLKIRYVIGGSVASGILGEPRSTLDLDLMAELSEAQAVALVHALEADYYVDEATVLEAVRRRSSFNVIHHPSAMKVDVFLTEDAPFAARQLDRSIVIEVKQGVSIRLYTPEDLIIRKLMWFRAGMGISDRQWRDVTGLLKASRSLDLEYLFHAAEEQGLDELLAKALKRAGFEPS